MSDDFSSRTGSVRCFTELLFFALAFFSAAWIHTRPAFTGRDRCVARPELSHGKARLHPRQRPGSWLSKRRGSPAANGADSALSPRGRQAHDERRRSDDVKTTRTKLLQV